jgi:hypothetical protein
LPTVFSDSCSIDEILLHYYFLPTQQAIAGAAATAVATTTATVHGAVRQLKLMITVNCTMLKKKLKYQMLIVLLLKLSELVLLPSPTRGVPSKIKYVLG